MRAPADRENVWFFFFFIPAHSSGIEFVSSSHCVADLEKLQGSRRLLLGMGKSRTHGVRDTVHGFAPSPR